MTPSDKPQDPDARTQGEPDSASTMTRATDGGTNGTPARSSSGQEAGGAGNASAADGAATGSGDTPPWHRSTSSAGSSDGSSSYESADSHRASGASAERPPATTAAAGGPGGPEAENTQATPPPLRGTSRGDAPADTGSGQESARGGRTTVSFAGAGSQTTSTSTGAAQGAARRPSRGPRRASLQIKRVDPWSVLKLALVLSVALFFVWMIAIAVLYGVLGGMGVWDQLNGTFTELTQPENSIGQPLISAGRVFGVASIIGAINIVLITALATVAAFIYNVATDLVGGVELTLSERE